VLSDSKTVTFKALILKFSKKGEKSGWTYIEIPADIARQLKPGNKKSFRVKGSLDRYEFRNTALLPMGKGDFILPLNASVRRAIGKNHGAMIKVKLTADETPFQFDPDFIQCINDEPGAKEYFEMLPGAHQKYFSNWIASAKTGQTKAKRIAQSINAFLKKQDFGTMIRSNRKSK